MSSSSRVPLLVGGNKGRKPTRLPIAPRARPANVERAKRAPGAADDADATATTDAMTQGDEATPKPAAEPHRSPERAALPAVLPVAVTAPSVPAIQLPPPVSTPSPRPGGISPGSAIAVSLRRTAKKVGSYRDPSDSMDDPDGDDDADYEQTRDDDDDLDLPETDNPQIFMPARERATLWAKKVLEQSDDPNALALVPKKERTKRKRSNSASSVGSVATPRKSKTEDGPQKEPSQMTMGELALSIPKGRRMLRHEHEEAADHHTGMDSGLTRSRSLSLSSESASMGGSLVTPQVEIINGKMVISESTVKVAEPSSFAAPGLDEDEDSSRRPRGSRYLPPNSAPGRRWSKDETKQFYYRKELKSKFKYEEKHHPTLIEIALKASTAPLDSEIVDVISRMAEKDAQKKEAKRRSQSEDLGDGLQSPSTVSSTAVPTPPPVQEEFAEDRYGGYFRERKDSYDFSN
ncbi:hypothetical protein ATCC90586_000121 [Pythium insidiosum]|nr:hypothetical protein ATCC90586_000121 [Pythium insidiosum]